MRGAFISALADAALEDERIVLLTGDLGFMVVEKFARAHTDRFVNVGVAEANMVGIATGLARRGFVPFCYSIATFATMRAYEQIRNGPVLHRLPVRIVGTGGGFAYGTAGATHHAVEDIGIMRMLAGCSVICPAGDDQAVSALRAVEDWPGAVYVRLAKDSIRIDELSPKLRIGRVETVFDGAHLLLLTTGAMTRDVIAAAKRLGGEEGIRPTVAVVQCLSPAPVEDLCSLLERFPAAITVEDHNVTGGLGSLVAETAADHGLRTRIKRIGITGDLAARAGSEAYLRRQFSLDVDGIVNAARSSLLTAAG